MPLSKISSKSVKLHIPSQNNEVIKEFLKNVREYDFAYPSKLLMVWWKYFQYDTMPIDELAENILHDDNFKHLTSWDYKNTTVFVETYVPVQLPIRTQMKELATKMDTPYQRVVLYCWNQIANDIKSGLFTYQKYIECSKE